MPRLLALCLALGIAASVRAEAVPAAPAVPLSRDGFVTALTTQLVGHFNLEGELQLELLRPWIAPDRLARAWTLEISEFPLLPASSMLVRCRVLADGQPAGEYTVTLRAMLWRDAWAARQPLSALDGFDPALLEARRVDFFRERDALPATVGERGFMFARSIQPNRLLTWRDIARRPLVRKGDMVEVAAVEGTLRITMKGQALENGAVGDTVTVRNPETRKDFTAQVVAENRVQITF